MNVHNDLSPFRVVCIVLSSSALILMICLGDVFPSAVR